jgi:VIT1/CCC1 family predicted Fe2+/Mn2+ transporter
MLVEEHGLALSGPKPLISGAVTFVAFVAIGAIPLLPYLVPALRAGDIFPASVLMATVAFFGVGLLKGHLLHGGRLKAGAETVFAGALAASLAYAVGYGLQGLVNVD